MLRIMFTCPNCFVTTDGADKLGEGGPQGAQRLRVSICAHCAGVSLIERDLISGTLLLRKPTDIECAQIESIHFVAAARALVKQIGPPPRRR